MLGTGARRKLGSILAVVAVAALAACGQAGSSSDAGSSTAPGSSVGATQPSGPTQSSGATGAAPTTADPRDEGIPARPASLTDGPDACAGLAKGPWTQIPYGTDPLDTVRAGRTPQLSTAPDGPTLDDIVEFTSLADYDDPSTLIDPEAVMDAFAEAGFREGVGARHVDPDGAEVAVTALRFRDAAAAGSAMSAHLADYCGRAVSAGQRPQGNGMVVLRDSESVRTFFVLGDVEVSLYVCSCFYPDAEHRTFGVQWWAEQVEAALLAPEAKTDAS